MCQNQWSMKSSSGNVKISFLSKNVARIRIFPEGVDFADSALNKYGFIQETDQNPAVTEERDPQDSSTVLSCGNFSVRVAENGLVSAYDAAGNTLISMKDLLFKRESVTAFFHA